MIWAADFTEVKKETTEGNVTFVTYAYFATFAVGLCRGPIERMQKIWADGKLIWDLSVENGGVTGIEGLNYRLYLGDEEQLPDPIIESVEGEGEVPAFRGLAYIVFDDLPLEQFGNRIPNMNFELFTRASDANPYFGVEGTFGGGDSIMISPFDPTRLIACDSPNRWYRIDTLTATLQFSRTTPDIPFGANNRFDMDELGRIYTTKDDGPTDEQFVRLDSKDFDTTLTSGVTHHPTTDIKVIRNPQYPWLYAIRSGGASVFIVNRTTLTDDFGGVRVIDCPEAAPDYHSLASDDVNGRAFAYAYNILSPQTNNCWLTKFGGFAGEHFNVTDHIRGIGFITYDPETNQVLVGVNEDFAGDSNTSAIAFFDADTMAFLGKVTADETELAGAGFAWSDYRRGPVGGYFYVSSLTTIYRIDIANRAIDKTWAAPVSMALSGVYDPITHSYFVGSLSVGADQRIVKIPLDRGEAETVKLWEIVEDLGAQVGLDPVTELETSQLQDDVHGYFVNDRMPARGAIEPLMAAYFFDGVESDGFLKFPKRGGASLLTVEEGELGTHKAASDRPQELVTKRAADLEIPILAEVMYADFNADYNTGLESERRLITRSKKKLAYRFTLATTADHAKQIAVKQLALAWMERTGHEFAIPRKYTYLDAADVITVEEGEATHVVRIDELKLGTGVVQVRASNEDSSVYVSDATGVGIPPGGGVVVYEGPTILEMIDTMLTEYGNDYPGVFVAVMGTTGFWRGAEVFRSADGVGWNGYTANLNDAVMGLAVGALGNTPDPFVWDEGNTVTVRLLDDADSLAAATMEEVLEDRANFAILGDELIYFRSATVDTDGSYILSGLLRGRFGSDWATGTHAAGERFVLLNGAPLFTAWPLEDDNLERYVRAVSIGAPSTSGAIQAFTSHTRSLRPLSPQHIQGTRDGSNNLTITWIRRTRILGEWLDLADVPLGETSEAYSVDILNGMAVVRTINVTAQTASYTAAQQTTDGFTPGNPIDLIVYQVSAEVGRGFGTEATV